MSNNTINSPEHSAFTLFSRDIPVNYLNDRQEEIRHFITKIETEMHNQSEADQCYNDFTNLIRQEMYQKVHYKNIKLKEAVNNKKRRVKKPWWSEELTVLWNELCLKEKAMLKAEAVSKRIKREAFLRQRKLFNKEVQKAKRKYWKAKQIEIENLETSDQKAFWKQIGKIGIGQERKKDIPDEATLENGEISNNIEAVLHVWKTSFENLLLLFFFWIQFNIPFKTISLISRRANRYLGRNRSTPGKPPDTPASRTWLVSHVASAGLESTPVTAVR